MLDNLLNSYSLISKIGEGSFSEVLKVKDKHTGIFYAAKRLTVPFLSVAEVEECTELKTLKKLDFHPNVLNFVEYVYEADHGRLTFIFNLMDMSLYDYIKDRKRRLSEKTCKWYTYQLALGLEHLHKNGIFHRDLKPENILLRIDVALKRSNPLKAELIQLGDLGSVANSNYPQPRTEYISTRWYRAPECILTSGYYGPKMDIWALGCCFYEMFTLNPLFPGNNELDQLHKIHEIIGSPSEQMLERFKHCDIKQTFPKAKPVDLYKYVSSLSTGGIEILQKTLKYHPDCRISARKLVQQNYFKIFEDAKVKKSSSTDRYRLSSSGSERTSLRSVARKNTTSISLNSSFSSESKKSDSMKRLDAVTLRINHEKERSWNMPHCPKKASIINNIRCAVNNTKKSFD